MCLLLFLFSVPTIISLVFTLYLLYSPFFHWYVPYIYCTHHYLLVTYLILIISTIIYVFLTLYLLYLSLFYCFLVRHFRLLFSLLFMILLHSRFLSFYIYVHWRWKATHKRDITYSHTRIRARNNIIIYTLINTNWPVSGSNFR